MLNCIKENARLVIKKASLIQKKGHMRIYIEVMKIQERKEFVKEKLKMFH